MITSKSNPKTQSTTYASTMPIAIDTIMAKPFRVWIHLSLPPRVRLREPP